VDTDLDTLATALFVKTDDLLKSSPQLSDAELVTLAMMQAILGFTSEARWLRHARAHLRHLFPYLPKLPGYNKRLRKAAEFVRQVMGSGLHTGRMRPFQGDGQAFPRTDRRHLAQPAHWPTHHAVADPL
jgi:hypothetical protein